MSIVAGGCDIMQLMYLTLHYIGFTKKNSCAPKKLKRNYETLFALNPNLKLNDLSADT